MSPKKKAPSGKCPKCGLPLTGNKIGDDYYWPRHSKLVGKAPVHCTQSNQKWD